jgi:hypothetical protein
MLWYLLGLGPVTLLSFLFWLGTFDDGTFGGWYRAIRPTSLTVAAYLGFLIYKFYLLIRIYHR